MDDSQERFRRRTHLEVAKSLVSERLSVRRFRRFFHMAIKDLGRPREFVREEALRAAVHLFWVRGYSATSLDDLLSAMRIGRSSFYGTFGSKKALLLEALTLYTDELYAQMEAAGLEKVEPGLAVLSILNIAACTDLPQHGCLFINTAMELIPSVPEVREVGRRHLARIDKLIGTLLCRHGLSRPDARRCSGALLALAAGAVALRKAGESQTRIDALLRLAPALMNPT